ncbi:MAG: SRPBCC family protein [Rhodocyclaceae bacterium]|nr:SRPBCC family protein [Rhodocyclaceae bacterium]
MEDISTRSLSLTRTLDAPRELVWQVWTDPQHVVNWWGPDSFTNTNQSMDVRPGGLWRFVMHGPDGTDYKNLIQFIEVTKPERLVYAHRGEDETADIHFHATILFEEADGKTRLSMQMVFQTAEELRRVADEFGAREGAVQHLARLAAYLATMT